jgi:predicted DNA-binding transcriptional regulator AlpA
MAAKMHDHASATARPPADILPASLAPRGLSRPQAAAYIGVSASLFDQLVKDGRMPRPKRINGRVVWDRRRLDESFDAINDGGENPWDTA